LVAEGQTLAGGRYELFEPLGSGGMATVYRAQDHRLGVARAIKVLLPSYAEKPRVRARFEAEARTMAVLDHPAIVRVYDVGSNDETAWIVMEIVEGGSLLQRIGATGIDQNECLRHTSRILEALAVAHEHGVVHRDIKPHNVLIDSSGSARITDFGIARSAGITEESFTKTGTVMGTWAFMAPEQRVNAKTVDHTADIYGTGATLFAMATGQTPMDLFAADLDPEMLINVPNALLPLIRNSTLYQREKRYPDALSMLAEVQRVQAQLGLDPAVVQQSASQKAAVPETDPPPPTQAQDLAEHAAQDAQARLALDSIESNTPLPFRPATPKPVARPKAPPEDVLNTEPTENTIPLPPKTDRTLFFLVLILVLLVGGIVRRSMKDAPNAGIQSPPTSSAQQVPLPTEESTPKGTKNPSEAVPTPSPTPTPPESSSSREDPSPPPTPKPKPAPAAGDPDEGKKAEPTEDTPKEPVRPSGPPAIDHSPRVSARMGGFLPIEARIVNLRPIDIKSYSLTAYFRASGTARFQNISLTRNRSTWTGNIRISADMEAGVEYFLKARSTDSSGALGTLNNGSNDAPHRVRISSP